MHHVVQVGWYRYIDPRYRHDGGGGGKCKKNGARDASFYVEGPRRLGTFEEMEETKEFYDESTPHHSNSNTPQYYGTQVPDTVVNGTHVDSSTCTRCTH